MKKTYTQTELRLLLACFAAYTGAYISRCNLSPSLDAIAKTFGVSAGTVGLLPTCFALPYAAGQIFSGLLADRHSAFRMMAVGLFGSALLNVLFSFCVWFPLLVSLWLLNGLLQSLIWTPIVRIVALRFRDEVRDQAAFFISLTLIFGYLAAWGISGLLTSWLSWRVAFRVSGLVTAAISVPSLLCLKSEDAERPVRFTSSGEPRMPAWSLLRKSWVLVLLAACFANGYVRDSISNWAAKLLMDTQGIDLTSAVGIMLIIPAVNFLGIRVGESAYEHSGRNVYRSGGLMFAVCGVLCALLGPVSGRSFIGCVGILVTVSALSYGLNALLTVLAPMLFRSMNRVAMMAGLMDALFYVGSAFSGVLAGALADGFGWNAVFLSWAVISLLAALAMIPGDRLDPSRQSS